MGFKLWVGGDLSTLITDKDQSVTLVENSNYCYKLTEMFPVQIQH